MGDKPSSVQPQPSKDVLEKQIKDHLPIVAEHPLRYAIEGDMHLVPELKKIVEGTDISQHLKDFLYAELNDIETNAAEIHLHLVDHPHGGVSLQLHIEPRHLGRRRPSKTEKVKETIPAA